MEAAVVVIFILIFVLGDLRRSYAIKTFVQQHEQGLTERFGRYRKTLDPGFHMIMPFIDRSEIDMREQVVDVPPQEVDHQGASWSCNVDAVVYYRRTDPVKLAYDISNFIVAATKLAQTNLETSS